MLNFYSTFLLHFKMQCFYYIGFTEVNCKNKQD